MKAHHAHLARPVPPAAHIIPREKGQDRPRVPGGIPKIEVIGARVIKIDRQFHQAQPQRLGVEIQVALRIAGDGGNMMDSPDGILAYRYSLSPPWPKN